ncbi:MAG: DOMON domain-containing protein, partial [Flavobacteriales bacterium]
MKKISLLLLLVVSLTAYAQTYTTGTVTLSSTAGLAMTVKLDISTNVSLTLTGPSTRWFAVGFNASSMAAGTDVVGVHSAGALTAFDANLTGYSAPATDVQQNWTITSDQVAGGVRTVIATRALSTGDPNDY